MASKEADTPVRAKISLVGRFGLCGAVTLNDRRRAAFRLDRVIGYGGQPLRELGIREGAEVELFEDGSGQVDRVRLLDAASVS